MWIVALARPAKQQWWRHLIDPATAEYPSYPSEERQELRGRSGCLRSTCIRACLQLREAHALSLKGIPVARSLLPACGSKCLRSPKEASLHPLSAQEILASVCVSHFSVLRASRHKMTKALLQLGERCQCKLTQALGFLTHSNGPRGCKSPVPSRASRTWRMFSESLPEWLESLHVDSLQEGFTLRLILFDALDGRAETGSEQPAWPDSCCAPRRPSLGQGLVFCDSQCEFSGS